MQSTEQKLREALQKIIEIKNKMEGSDWEEIEEAREIARQALALPPADHAQSEPSVEFDLGETSSHTIKCVWSKWDAKANKLVLCLSVRDIETAAPVGEREAFEEWACEQFYSGLACPSDTWSDERKTYSDAAHHMAFCAFRAAMRKGQL